MCRVHKNVTCSYVNSHFIKEKKNHMLISMFTLVHAWTNNIFFHFFINVLSRLSSSSIIIIGVNGYGLLWGSLIGVMDLFLVLRLIIL